MASILRPGLLLLADPSLVDPNFDETVVLLCAHNEEGSLGLVLNRPLEVQVAQVISGTNPFHDNNLALRWGGPVGLDRLHVLHTGSREAGGAQEILEGVNFGGDFQSLLGLPSNEMALRFFLGYAGWDAGQLQGEMELGTWRTHPADPEVVFDTEPATLWHRLMGRLDSDLVWMRHIPRDPSVN